jgi:pimeloyl-ACP methyl ester carboxylesterase
VTTYSEIAAPPAPAERVRARVLLVRGEESYLPLTAVLPALEDALGDRLQIAVVPGGHTVFWDALEETAGAIARFLGSSDRASDD